MTPPPEAPRLDDLARSERYFTATLLPAILLHDNFSGAREFVRLVDQKAQTEWAVDEPLNPTVPQQQVRGVPDYDWTSPELIAEVHVARDLYAAGVRWIPPRSRGPEESDGESRDAPDLLLALGSELIVCEGKFFHREPQGKLASQLRRQRRQIAYLFRYRHIRAFCHVAVLPDPPYVAQSIGADAILTWEEIVDCHNAYLRARTM
jgi:hypothetical protein